MSTLYLNRWLNPDGTENYKCRAWVNFNGTGTVAIRASGNVSSITDNGVGNYTVNFIAAFADTSYAVVGSAGTVVGSAVNRTFVELGTKAVGGAQIKVTAAAYVDVNGVDAAFFR